jgi:hypothetical protein
MTAAHAHLRGVDALDERDDLDETLTLTRSLSDADRARFERYIAEIFEAAGSISIRRARPRRRIASSRRSSMPPRSTRAIPSS